MKPFLTSRIGEWPEAAKLVFSSMKTTGAGHSLRPLSETKILSVQARPSVLNLRGDSADVSRHESAVRPVRSNPGQDSDRLLMKAVQDDAHPGRRPPPSTHYGGNTSVMDDGRPGAVLKDGSGGGTQWRQWWDPPPPRRQCQGAAPTDRA